MVFQQPEEFDKFKLDKVICDLQADIMAMRMACISHSSVILMWKIQNLCLKNILAHYLRKPKENRYKDNGVRMIKGSTTANIKKGKESQSLVHNDV